MRTHFAITPPLDTTEVPACGQSGRARKDTNTFAVDCKRCQNSDSFILAHDEAKSRRDAAFQAQTPRTVVPQFGRVNADGVMDCRACGGILWRERPRSLHSYHYVCAGCGTSVYPLTETGMCS